MSKSRKRKEVSVPINLSLYCSAEKFHNQRRIPNGYPVLPLPTPPFTVIIAANNEESYIGRCLEALLAQDAAAGPLRIVVAANACRDATVAIVQGMIPKAKARGWELICDNSPEPGKIKALNRADAAARPGPRAYLDADVICDHDLIGQLRTVLDHPIPAYASGTLAVVRATSWVTRAYGDLWTRLPFVQGGAVGAGLFAVNAAGRARWSEFPPIISDDTFVRLNFAPSERHEVPASYHWPMVEGWRNLIHVRRRQDAGVAEVYRLYPDLKANEDKAEVARSALLRLACSAPLGFVVYAIVRIAVRLRPPAQDWSRGR